MYVYFHYVVAEWILPHKPDVTMWHLLFIVVSITITTPFYLVCMSAIGIRGEIQRNSRLLTVRTGFGAREQVLRPEVDVVKLVAASPLRVVWNVVLLRRDNRQPVLLAKFFVLAGFEEHKRSVAAENFATTVGDWLDCPVMRD